MIAMLCVDFNPFPSSPKYFYYLNYCLSFMTRSKVGRWYIEREQVFKIIRANVEARGIDKFHMPSEKKRVKTKTSSKGAKDKGSSKSKKPASPGRGRSATRGASPSRLGAQPLGTAMG